MPRWSAKEQECLNIIRTRLQEEISSSPPYPEIIGDRKIIRFLRGHDYNLEKVTELYRKFLNWRKTNQVNEIRTNIVEKGMNHPSKFPKGELILSLIPQLTIAPDALDKQGSPICVEQYNFSPSLVLSKINLQDYIVFMTYCLEYRSLIIEQLSEEREQQYLSSLTNEQRQEIDSPTCKLPPYGVLVHTCVIRDLSGVGFEHLGSQGLEIIKTVVALASDNYPELMRKCFMINTPWVFNTAWYFVKGLLAARTIAKVAVLGTSFKDELAKDVVPANLPSIIGGPYVGYLQYVAFPFNMEYLCPHLTPTLTAPIDDAATPATVASDNNDNTVAMTESVPSTPILAEDVSTTKASIELPVSSATTATSTPTPTPTPAPSVPPQSSSNTDDYDDDSNSNNGGIDINLISLQTSGY